MKKVLSFVKGHYAALLILALSIFLIVSIRSCTVNRVRLKEERMLIKTKDSLLKSAIKYYKDKAGKIHATVDNTKIESDIKIPEIESVAKTLNIKPKQISGYSQTATLMKVDEKLNVDSSVKYIPCPEGKIIPVVSQYNFHWNDAWTNINGTVGNGNDSVHVVQRDTLTKVDYWKRKWLLGAKSYYSDIQNSNQHITTTGYKGVQFIKKEKQWSVGISAQIGYPLNQPINLKKPTLSLGIGLQRTIFKF